MNEIELLRPEVDVICRKILEEEVQKANDRFRIRIAEVVSSEKVEVTGTEIIFRIRPK